MTLEEGAGSNWFNNEVVRSVGNGGMTRFWRDKWVGNTPFFVNFPRLYSISNQKEDSVGDLWEGGERRDLAIHMTKGTYIALEEVLPFDIGLSGMEEDVFREIWKSLAPSKVLPFS